MEFVNYAHRGASAYAPENTLASFYLGCQMGANGVETDVQRTKDGVLVLFHDNDLMRIAGRPEAIQDLTYQELLKIDFGEHMGEHFRGEKIPTLEEFLRHFGGKELHFAIEIKERGVEEETLRLIRQYCRPDHVIVTSGIWDALICVRALDPEMRVGYLCKYLTDSLIAAAKKEGLYQLCPKASILTPEWNERMRQEGFSVRAWGVDSPDTMRRLLALHVDGMTINFPDVLVEALKEDGER